ncbi:MAG: lysophospholipid acyltransferase family protein [Fibromonadaceae bacterium]|jgi:KDO2-lipid IV(A) lauroyltransferase|nr:lysophospholipid acyltransferase family protein [Fibromonadaceae bacterium]
MGFPKMTFTENLRLTKPFFDLNGKRQPKYSELMLNMFGDAFVFLFLYNRKKNESFVVDENSIAILEEMKGGGIFLAAHYGNHELLGYRLAELGLPLNSASVVQKPEFFDKFLQRKRTFKGKCFALQKSPKEALQFIENGGLFGLIADQDFRKSCPRKYSEKCQSKFLGVEVNCNPFPIFILEHYKKTPVFCGHLRQGKKNQTLFLKKLNTENLYNNYHSWLENLILENPAKWYGWVHGRFKFLPSQVNGQKAENQ